MHKLEVDSILLEFGVKRILSDVFIKCETGKITGILGRNGQGKTCLMNIIYGSLDATSKSVRFDNVSIFHAYKYPKLLMFLPQFNFIPKSFTVKRIFNDFNLEYDEFKKHFQEYEHLYKSSLKKLSGGERRLIETYMIIKAKSSFAMLDEPFTHLMPLQIEKLKEILSTEKNKKGFLITDHLFKHVTDICDSLYILTNAKTHLVNNISDIERLGYTRI